LKQKLNQHKNNGSNSKQKETDENDVKNDKVAFYEKNIKSHFKIIRFILICGNIFFYFFSFVTCKKNCFKKGRKLEMGDLSLATATIIYNRFFYSCEFSQFDPYVSFC
jgi:hypothetical protein